MTIRIGIILVCFIALFSSCSIANKTSEIPTTYPIDNSLPISENINKLYDSSYPIEETPENSNLLEQITITKPTSGYVTIHGILISISQNNTAYIAPSLFLGEVVVSSNDPENGLIVGSISIENDPIAQQSTNGDFIFENVPPGDYGLFIWTPASAFLIRDTQTKQPITFTANADEIIDLGVIYVP